MATINLRALQLAVDKPVERACRQAAINIANERFDEAKQEFLQEFLDHPVSQEIEAGAKQEGGLLEEGNLFGFLGFQDGSDPVGDLYRFLDEHTYIGKTPRYDRTSQKYIFNIYTPSKEDIKEETPTEWGTARSWAYSIETGIPGLNHYLFSQKRDLGRSTGGIQVKGNVNDIGAFKPQKYLTDLFKSFVNNLKGSR